MKDPTSRFGEATESLPQGWRTVKLGKLIASYNLGFASGDRDPNGVVQLRMNNVDTRGNFVWKDFLRVPADQATIEQYRLEIGDVLFNNTNSTELVGKSAYFTGHGEPVVFSNHFTRLRPFTEELRPSFLTIWLNHQWNSGLFARICNRWIGQSAVKPDKLLALDIALPKSPDVQDRIAETYRQRMAIAEHARHAAEDQLRGIRALPAALLREAFSGTMR